MLRIAIKMLFGDGARFYGILLGLAFASLLIAQQSSIFVGLMSRTSAFIRDTPQADIWVTDPDLLSVDDAKALRDTDLQRVRGVPGVAWAVPLFKGLLGVKLGDGRRTVCEVVGIDDATLIGGPHTMLDGQVADLRQADAVIVDNRRLARELRMATGERGPDGKPVYRPMQVGDEMELNERRAVVVGDLRQRRELPVRAAGLHDLLARAAVPARRPSRHEHGARQGGAGAGSRGTCAPDRGTHGAECAACIAV